MFAVRSVDTAHLVIQMKFIASLQLSSSALDRFSLEEHESHHLRLRVQEGCTERTESKSGPMTVRIRVSKHPVGDPQGDGAGVSISNRVLHL